MNAHTIYRELDPRFSAIASGSIPFGTFAEYGLQNRPWSWIFYSGNLCQTMFGTLTIPVQWIHHLTQPHLNPQIMFLSNADVQLPALEAVKPN
ncbi:hypothetical protein AVEN_256119-1 [Araneus ventricosus]|uniref:Uncharacterized protein n=1 Tax=Araneus ventricosus TaxID=182803 RepID=A0A4Y2D7D2_ARAVE|nr:hypothetical protein AVEN_256119-1 [Araneus ventricosus]